MMPPRRHTQSEEGTDSWLMSYADMITLLMCFFIIFVSVSEPKRDKFTEITEGLANKFGSVDIATPFNGVFSALQLIIENNELYRDIAIDKTDRSVEMEIAGGAFFVNDSADIDPSKMQVLAEMVATLKTVDYLDYRMSVEAHTSDRIPQSALYKSNWDLSAARSARMVEFFITQGIPADRIRASALADTRPKVPNTTSSGDPIPENRARNERVMIKLERVI